MKGCQRVLVRLATFDEVVQAKRIDPSAVQVFVNRQLGRSVKACRAFKPGECVCTYGGRLIEETPDSDDERDRFLLEIGENLWIDGTPRSRRAFDVDGHVGPMINDAHGEIRAPNGPNLRFSRGRLRVGKELKIVVFLKALRRIEEGEELFVSYGPHFWD